MLNTQPKSRRSESQRTMAERKLRRARTQLDAARTEAERSVEHARNAAAATRDAAASGASAAVRRADSRIAVLQNQTRDATRRLEAKARVARDRVADVGRSVVESGHDALEGTRRRIGARPLASVLSTAAAGVAVGWILSARSRREDGEGAGTP